MEYTLDKPFFMTIEGVDCCGKTTIMSEIETYCLDNDIKFTKQSEKFIDPVRNKIFESAKVPTPQTQMLYWWTARRYVINTFYNSSTNILMLDRYYDSTYVYQNLINNRISCIFNFNDYFFPTPNLTIYLKIPANISVSRILSTRKEFKSDFKFDPYERIENIENYVNRYNYLYLNEEERPKNESHVIEIIDATNPISTVKKMVLTKFREEYDKYIQSNG